MELSWRDFFEACWPLVEGGRTLQWNWHLDVIGEYLTAFRKREISNLIICQPPRTTKSMAVSVVYPPWVWATQPWHQFLSVSNEEDLAVRDAAKSKLIVQSAWYQALWGHKVKLQPGRNQASFYETTERGARMAEGLHSKITGKGGDCVPGETLVATERGRISIACLHEMSAGKRPRVWSMAPDGHIELRRIVNARRIANRRTIRIITLSGDEVECTPDHRIWSGNGYRPAEDFTGRALPVMRIADVRASHRSRPDEQRSDEPDHALRCLPHEAPQVEASAAYAVDIGVGENGAREIDVYDIEVEGSRNFFAGGILVHNSVIIDDPHDSDKVHSDVSRKSDLDAYDHKLSTRLNDRKTGGFCIIMQRQHHQDLVAYVQAKKEQKWTTLVLPMEYEGPRYVPINPRAADPRKRRGELLDPGRVSKADVAQMREDLGHAAEGQLQQNPTQPGGTILKMNAWRMWPTEKPLPTPLHVMQVYDTAYTEEDFADASYSARTTWAIFLNEENNRHEIMLIEAWRDRIGYPDLRRKVKADFMEWRPGRIIVEKKASGISLIQDMRRIKPPLPVSRYLPDRDKVARAWAASPILDAGRVWYPDRKWAEPVIKECAEFPSGAHDDWVDTCTMAWLWLMKGWWVVHPDDEDAEDEKRKRRKPARAPYGG